MAVLVHPLLTQLLLGGTTTVVALPVAFVPTLPARARSGADHYSTTVPPLRR